MVNIVENNRRGIFTRLVSLDINDYNYRRNNKLYKKCFNVIVRPIYLFP